MLDQTPIKFIPPIPCAQCDERAYIIRRVLDAIKRDGSEIWTFHNTEKFGKH